MLRHDKYRNSKDKNLQNTINDSGKKKFEFLEDNHKGNSDHYYLTDLKQTEPL